MALWNPWHGCHKFSAGCQNCYVYRTDSKYEKDSSVVTKTKNFDLPVQKNKSGLYKFATEETVFTCFTSDFFVEDADEWRPLIWNMMKTRFDLEFLFITKRIHRFNVGLPDDWGDGYDNVHICCTVENQSAVDYRLPIFLGLPIKKKSIICEPLLEQVDLSEYLDKEKIIQVVAGGESGNQARICSYDWILKIREQCINADLGFYFKQTGARFVKEKKLYNIPRKIQHAQARKADIDYKAVFR